MIQEFQITVGSLFTIHISQTVCQQAAVEADEIGFGQFSYQRGDILVFHIGVGIVLATAGRVGSIAIIHEEFKFVSDFTVFQMFLTIQHIRFGHAVIMFCHQGDFHLVLDFIYVCSVTDTDTA